MVLRVREAPYVTSAIQSSVAEKTAGGRDKGQTRGCGVGAYGHQVRRRSIRGSVRVRQACAGWGWGDVFL